MEERTIHAAAEKIDEYGRIGHCDMTARLDNLAIQIQNDPSAKALLITYGPRGKESGFADGQLRIARHYLVFSRGLDPARVLTVNGGLRYDGAGVTELWFVPEGAVMPVEPPKEDRYGGNFSGKFDSYVTDDQKYQELVEMGYSDETIAHNDFVEKLKNQPESLGYVVVRTAKESLPGAWQRIMRREERRLGKELGAEAVRLKTVYGGQWEGNGLLVELWVLPRAAEPPPSVTEVLERKITDAFKLNTYEAYGDENDDAEQWMIENLADVLRQNPNASACLIAREPYEDPSAVEGETEETTAEPDVVAVQESAEQEKAAESVEESSLMETAERWKKVLVEKFGISPHRILLMEKRPWPWRPGRLTSWVVPKGASLPNPYARDEDELEEEETTPAGGADADRPTAAAVRLR